MKQKIIQCSQELLKIKLGTEWWVHVKFAFIRRNGFYAFMKTSNPYGGGGGDVDHFLDMISFGCDGPQRLLCMDNNYAIKIKKVNDCPRGFIYHLCGGYCYDITNKKIVVFSL